MHKRRGYPYHQLEPFKLFYLKLVKSSYPFHFINLNLGAIAQEKAWTIAHRISYSFVVLFVITRIFLVISVLCYRDTENIKIEYASSSSWMLNPSSNSKSEHSRQGHTPSNN
jgi:hypothetical protein